MQYKHGNRDPATPLHETIVDFLCNTMGAHGQQVSTFYRISLMGFTGSRVWMDMDGYMAKRMQTDMANVTVLKRIEGHC